MITLDRILEFVTGMIVYGFVDALCLMMAGVLYVGYKEHKKTKEDKHHAEDD